MLMLSGVRLRTRSSLPLALRCFTRRGLGKGSEVRINGVVHLKTHLAAGETVPIGWIAVGNPAQVLPPVEHDRIWHIQRQLDFPRTVYGFERGEATTGQITHRLSEMLSSHTSDEVQIYHPS